VKTSCPYELGKDILSSHLGCPGICQSGQLPLLVVSSISKSYVKVGLGVRAGVEKFKVTLRVAPVAA